jgi:CheY-like chemotaxis protein
MAGEDRARSCSVLVVDDDEDIRETLRDVLQDEGYVVATARDGQQAMHYLTANAAQVIMLLDLMMPVKNGWMVLADLAAQPGLAARVRVVVVSAAGRAKTNPIADVVEAVLEKPVHLPALLAMVRRLTGPAAGAMQAG